MLRALEQALVQRARVIAQAKANLEVDVLHPQALGLVEHRLA
jgi:hypothetical protein